jgi:hypothetical protein
LQENPAASGALTPDRLRALCDPAAYLGMAPEMADQVVRMPRNP